MAAFWHGLLEYWICYAEYFLEEINFNDMDVGIEVVDGRRIFTAKHQLEKSFWLHLAAPILYYNHIHGNKQNNIKFWWYQLKSYSFSNLTIYYMHFYREISLFSLKTW